MHNGYELLLTNYPTVHPSRQKWLGSHGHCSGHAGTANRMLQCWGQELREQGAYRLPSIFLCTGAWDWLEWFWESWVRHCEVEWQSAACQYLQVNMDLEWLEMRPHSSYSSIFCPMWQSASENNCIVVSLLQRNAMFRLLPRSIGNEELALQPQTRKEEVYDFQF